MSTHHARLWSGEPKTRRRRYLITSAALATALAASAAAVGGGGSASGSGTSLGSRHVTGAAAADPAVITDWNTTAVATLVTDAARTPAETYVYIAFTQAAMHNAVVGITREYKPYKWHAHGPKWASPEAAAASAAYHLLLKYFPDSQPRLDAAYAASLAGVPDGAAERAGIKFGHKAAKRIIDLRADDGRYAPLEFTKPPAPGVWRPTSDPPVPFSTPWLSQMTPLVIQAPDQFRPGPPPALSSTKYAREFNEVKALGGATGSMRSPWQTRTALFFSDSGVVGLQAALCDLVTRHHFDISDAARMLALADVAAADGLVSTWDAKFHYGFWRPVTAIHLADTDGNPATAPDPTWTSFLANPPYPDYTSGLNTAVGAISRAVAHVLGSNRVDLSITSTAAAQTRHYSHARSLNHQAIDARIWGGLHFRTADVVGNHRAQRIATYVFHHAFQPTH